jgi:hypothetical protein
MMKESFIKYAQSVGLGEPLQQLVDKLYTECLCIADDEIEEIIISDIVQQDGTRVYDILYFFSKSLVFEIENFVAQPKIWIAVLSPDPKAVLIVERTDFDLKEAKKSSRIFVQIRWGNSFLINPKGSGDNCLHVFDVMKRFLVPKIFPSIK